MIVRERAQQVRRIETCDIVLLCYDAVARPRRIGSSGRWRRCSRLGDGLSWWLPHDLDGGRLPLVVQAQPVSIHLPASIDQLRDRLSAAVQAETGRRFTRVTHHTAVRCREAAAGRGRYRTAQTLLAVTAGEELVASELHCVLEELSAIIGGYIAMISSVKSSAVSVLANSGKLCPSNNIPAATWPNGRSMAR